MLSIIRNTNLYQPGWKVVSDLNEHCLRPYVKYGAHCEKMMLTATATRRYFPHSRHFFHARKRGRQASSLDSSLLFNQVGTNDTNVTST
jgi:hypothetical protein